jgi:hypothetical protein
MVNEHYIQGKTSMGLFEDIDQEMPKMMYVFAR